MAVFIPGADIGLVFEELRFAHGIAHDLRHIEIGDGEAVADEIVAPREMQFQRRERHFQHAAGHGNRLAAAFAGLLSGVMHQHDLHGLRLQFGGGPERPPQHLAFLGNIGRRERSAMLLDEIERDGQRFGQHKPVIIDRGDLGRRVDGQEIR